MRVLYLISDIIYPILYYIVGYRRKVVRKNLVNSFPEKSLNEIKKIERKFYKHFCDTIIEAVYRINISADEYKRRALFENTDIIKTVYAQGKSAIITLGHLGNWEWTPAANLYLPEDFPMNAVYKELKNKEADALIYKLRTKYGGKNIEMRNLIKTMLQMSKNGERGLFMLLGDQRPARDYNRYSMNFMNQQTSVLMGAEVLAKKFNYPVFYLSVSKLKRGHYKYSVELVCEDAAQEPEFSITHKCMKHLEADIKRSPELWLWSHNRWKY